MLTHLYIPLTDFKINSEAGHRLLYENLVQSGPAYKLIVHESPSWVELKDRMPWPEIIEIMPEKKAKEYAHIAHRFFLPVASELGVADKKFIKDTSLEFHSLVKLIEYRQILTYLMIAHDYKSRILGEFFLEHARLDRLLPTRKDRATLRASIRAGMAFPPERVWTRCEHLEKLKKSISEDGKARIDFIEGIIWGYKHAPVPTLSTNKNPRIFDDLKSLLEKEKVRKLSEENSSFSFIDIRKDLLKRRIRFLLADIVKSEWFPYLTGGVTLCICYYAPLQGIRGPLSFISGAGSKILSKIVGKYDFREFVPAFQSAEIFEIAEKHKRENERPSFQYDAFFSGGVGACSWF